MDRKDAVDEGDKVRIKPTAAPSTLGHRNEFRELRIKVGSSRSSSGKQVCLFFNTIKGCIVKNFNYGHVCCVIKSDGRLCSATHKMKDHK